MKPDKKTCLNCTTEIGNRAKFCSDKCRKQYERNSDKRSDKANSDKPNSELGQANSDKDEFRATLTKTDKTFYDRAMRDFKNPYYIFTGEVTERVCDTCKDKFKTAMPLLRYCSYEHYSNTIGGKK